MKLVTQIDELKLTVFAGAVALSKVVQTKPARVEVEFSAHPGQPAILCADPDASQEGFPPYVSIGRVIALEPIELDNDGIAMMLSAGANIRDWLPTSARDLLEEEALKAAEAAAEVAL
ncbi:hypothetical protein [Noviherbaspirillum malthae]|uniref:hypothetical protein n=1 Tax=Noviherbaspirillum malthae TaxID=1260987 RepID=UPI00188FB791|nr:hypothetical protein [Noviherbaspirillum malthae]